MIIENLEIDEPEEADLDSIGEQTRHLLATLFVIFTLVLLGYLWSETSLCPVRTVSVMVSTISLIRYRVKSGSTPWTSTRAALIRVQPGEACQTKRTARSMRRALRILDFMVRGLWSNDSTG